MAVTCSVRAVVAALLLAPHLAAHAQAATERGAGQPDAGPNTAAALSEITVTGSRVITDGSNSPTQITAVATEQLTATSPTNIPDALNKLPQFVGSSGQGSVDNASSNSVGNFLNLRSVGVGRNLILFDGIRLAPSATSGAIDTNTIPQILLERVDVVTGGASAVYGSDAVSGVVNFVANRNFDGRKAFVQGGISERRDAETVRTGLAAGAPLFGGRGHIEGSFEYYDTKGIPERADRENGRLVYTLTGQGTQASPFRLTPNSRLAALSFGGHVLSGPFADANFSQNGIVTPFVHGAPTDSPGTESGGDGGFFIQSELASLETKQGFARFDLDVTDNTTFHAQGFYTQAETSAIFIPFVYLPNSGPTFIAAENGFLPTQLRQQLVDANAPGFVFAKFSDAVQPELSDSDTRSYFANAGLDGSFGPEFRWSLELAQSETQLRQTNVNNIHSAKFAAALDPVIAPGTYTGSDFLLNSSGQRVVCNVTLTNPDLYPGCLPLNPFGPSSEDLRAVDYVRDDTQFTLTNRLRTVAASVTGSPFDAWAGPVRAALSGEYREVSLRNVSNAQPVTRADCTGIRFNCGPTFPEYLLNVTADAAGEQSIKEAAIEMDAPILAEKSIAQSLNVNGAFRFTDYSTSGSVRTWKVGVDWHLDDALSFRATRSRDIRAPTVYELFAPLGVSVGGYTDVLTGRTGFVQVVTQGNKDLQPEVAKVLTIGAVYRPSWLPHFNIALDYFDIEIGEAIENLSGADQSVQRQCISSGGTSPLCSLATRPINNTDTSAANFPTQVFVQGVNLSTISTRGVDVDMNYSPSFAGGTWSFRALVTYQPRFVTVRLSGDPELDAAGAAGLPTVRATGFINFARGPFTVNLQQRWHSSTEWDSDPTLVYEIPKMPARAFTDLGVTARTSGSRINGEFFLTVLNLFDTSPAKTGTGAGVPGLAAATNGDDIMGRFFLAGYRAEF